jgi:integrase
MIKFTTSGSGDKPTDTKGRKGRRRAGKPSKPAKPYPDFPLFPHATRRWAKKIRGKLHYFGPWEDWRAALAKYQEQKDDLHAGRTPRTAGGALTIRDLLNRFLTSKKRALEAEEITPRTFGEYYTTSERIAAAFGRERFVGDLASEDFEALRADLAARLGPTSLGNEIQRVRCVFKYGYEAGLTDRPVRYGPTFKKPAKKVLRKARAARGPRMFEAAELRKLVDAAGVQLKAMLLLGINCGFGNADVGLLPVAALDLDRGWVNYPRPKTGIERRCPLWPQTVAAVRAALAARPAPKDPADAGLVFITKYGKRWHKEAVGARRTPELTQVIEELGLRREATANPLCAEVAKLLKGLGLHRPGLNFYALRHTFETIGGESRDQVAVDSIMGHAREDMASIYRERVSDDRLLAVVGVVHCWLFPPAEEKPRRGRRATG